MDIAAPVLLCGDASGGLEALARQLRIWALTPVLEGAEPHAVWAAIGRQQPGLMVFDVTVLRRGGPVFPRLLRVRWPAPVVLLHHPDEDVEPLRELSQACDAVACLPRGRPQGLGPELRARWRTLLIDLGLGLARGRGFTTARTPARQQRIVSVKAAPPRDIELILIGASAGGPEAVERLLAGLPASGPPVLVVIHMPATFTNSYADRLNLGCAVEVRQAVDGEPLPRNTALIAAGGRHLRLQRLAGRLATQVDDGAAVSGHRPSVDALFESLVPWARPNHVAIILTGMGADGAAGLAALSKAGVCTVAQAKQGCAVYGMPKSAVAAGGVQHELVLEEMAAWLCRGW
jgi:two-component system, chemotaxis family, protein-glutamate methylesterase/glutaminase